MKSTLVMLLMLAAGALQAAPVPFTTQAYTTSALAYDDTTLDGPDDQSADVPPDALPIASAAAVTTATAYATADAGAADGLLTASTTAGSTGSLEAAGIAVTSFLGTFTSTAGGLSLHIDFDDLSSASVLTALAVSTLAVSLVVDGLTLFDDVLLTSATVDEAFSVAAGLAGTLELTLISNASAFFDGDAANTASAAFRLDHLELAEPGALALLLGGFVLIGVGRRRAASRSR